MPEEINQLMQGGDNPDQTAAVLAFATKLSEGMLPKRPQTQEMGGTSPQNPQGGVEPVKEEKPQPEADNKEVEKMMDSKLDKLRKEMKETIKNELSEIKDIIKEALEEDEE